MSSFIRSRAPLALLASTILVIWLVTAGLFCQLNRSLSETDEEFQTLHEFITLLSAELNQLQWGIAAVNVGNKSYSDYLHHDPRKREADSEKCSMCGQSAERCPRGAAGQTGQAGEPGEDGFDGLDGDPGAPGIALVYEQETPGCIVCPAGPAGPVGPAGEVGPSGEEGEVGSRGSVGRAGQPGPKGPSGDTGQSGSIGEAGEPGRNGIRGTGHPGRPGPEGPIGEIGQPGLAGTSARVGALGLPGPIGPRGVDGVDGTSGGVGEPGQIGDPGPDAQYCPCPHRSTSDDSSTKPSSLPKFRAIEKWSPRHVSTAPSASTSNRHESASKAGVNIHRRWFKTTLASEEANKHQSRSSYHYDRVQFRKALLKKKQKADKRQVARHLVNNAIEM